jgi:CRISPR/Cas system CSM-associated protein Csm3 (group 7 of RAMP superfamily)
MNYRAFTGRLVARTAVHIGMGEASFTTDAPLRRTAAGEVVLPGTAIAGALRAMVTRLAPRIAGSWVCKAMQNKGQQNDSDTGCGCDVCQLFGDVNQSDDLDSKTGASHILVFDAITETQQKAGCVRDGVGIERASGAAARASASKFDLEILPPQTSFTFRIELLDGVTEQGERLIAAALAEWQAGRVWLGGRVARGLGAFMLHDLALVTHDLSDAQGILTFLKSDQPWQITDQGSAQQQGQTWLRENLRQITITPRVDEHRAVASSWVAVEGTLVADGPFLTNDPSAATESGFDHAPLLVAPERWLHPVLPGASLRGVLRSQAERIARTLASHAAWQQPQQHRARTFNAMCPACDPLVRRTPGGQAVAMESCDSWLRHVQGKDGNDYMDEEELCLACRLFGSSRRGSRLFVEDALFAGRLPQYKMLDFLAIDRFTGGGADRLKFDALVLWKPAFRVRLHLENPQPWELGWLTLVLRDLHDGLLFIGYGAARGFGRVRITGWKLRFGLLDPQTDWPLASDATSEARTAAEQLLAHAKADRSAYSELAYHDADREEWLAVAQDWVRAFNALVKTSEARSPDLRLPHDTYFDHPNMAEWYPLMMREGVQQ